MKKKIERLFKISLYKTFLFNMTYFGFLGVIRCYALVSRDVKLSHLGGKIVSNMPLHTGCMHIGFPNVGIIDHRFQRSIWDNNGKIILNGHISLGSGMRLSNHGEIEFGDNFNLNANSTIVCHKRIKFGNDVLISWDVLLMDTDFHKVFDNSDLQTQINPPQEIVIGDNVWIGYRCFISKGCKIANGCVVASLSKLTGVSDESNSIIGDRGKIIKKNITWKM